PNGLLAAGNGTAQFRPVAVRRRGLEGPLALSTTEQDRGARPRVLLVGDFPPPHGGVAVHVETLQKAIRAAGGEADVLDIGSGQVPADGVHPAGGHLAFAAQLAAFAARRSRVHVHTGGDSVKSWLLAASCAAAAGASRLEPLITLHSGLCVEWLAGGPARRALAGAVRR